MTRASFSATVADAAAARVPAPPMGDRVVLPTALLASLEPLMQDARRPLLFELRNTRNGCKAYGGVWEFSAPDDTIVLPHFLHQALGAQEGDVVRLQTVDLAKGTYAKLQPLSNAYTRVPDFRALLETHLRTHYCTLSQGEVLVIPQVSGESIEVCIIEVKPGTAISVTDTELAVDVVPLETVAQQDLSGPQASNVLRQGYPMDGHVSDRDQAVFLRFPWQPGTPFLLKIEKLAGDINVFLSGSITTPSPVDNDIAFIDSGSGQVIGGLTTHPPSLAGEYYVGIYGYTPGLSSFRLRLSVAAATATAVDPEAATLNHALDVSTPVLTGFFRCENCRQPVPEATRMQHDLFCARNNTYCPICAKVYLKKDAAQHWHCQDCGLLIPAQQDREKHLHMLHRPIACTCNAHLSLDQLRTHRRQTCPDRVITCAYCGNRVKAGPREGHTALSEHESYCGSRTIDCEVCQQSVQIKMFESHSRLHELERLNRPLPFVVCRSIVCSRPAETTNGFQLCRFCFSPLYSATLDPGHVKLRQRLVFKYLSQLTQGCSDRKTCPNKTCCKNANPEFTKTEPKHLSSLAEQLANRSLSEAPSPFYLCVDASTSQRRIRADQLSQLGYPVEWGIKAVEEVEKRRRTRGDDSDDDDDDDVNKDNHRVDRKLVKDVMTEAAEWLLKHAPPPQT